MGPLKFGFNEGLDQAVKLSILDPATATSLENIDNQAESKSASASIYHTSDQLVSWLRFQNSQYLISMNTLSTLPTDIVLSIIEHTEAESSLSLTCVSKM